MPTSKGEASPAQIGVNPNDPKSGGPGLGWQRPGPPTGVAAPFRLASEYGAKREEPDVIKPLVTKVKLAREKRRGALGDRRAQSAASETNFRVALIGLAAALVAAVLLWVAAHDGWLTGPWRATLEQTAGLIMATGLLAAAWETVGRRRFAAEVLAKAKLSADVVDAGILRVTDQYLEDVEWADLFAGAMKVDIVVAYGRTWRNTHMERLRSVADTPGARLRVFLPDPDHLDTMRVLAERFATDPADIANTVREAVTAFQGLRRQSGGGTVEVWVRPGDAVFSCYRFDDRAVLTLYSHGRERRTSVPTWVVGTGRLFKFIRDDIDAIRVQSHEAAQAGGSNGAAAH